MRFEIPTLAISTLWVGGSQLAMRLGRILTTIVVARMIAPELLGVVAIALAANELAHVIAKNATNGRIIRADDDELSDICNTAYYVNWLVGIALFFLQVVIGWGLSLVYSNPTLLHLVAVLSFSYLLLPIAQVHSAVNLRNEKIGLISKTEIQQTFLDSALTVLMVFAGFGVWSLVLPKLLVVPLWIKAHLDASHWKTPKKITLYKLNEHWVFNSRVMGVELLGVVRQNIDYILIGYFLGMQALGIYYFAFNAGLGITRGFILSLNNAFYPHLCAVKSDHLKLHSGFVKGLRYMLLLLVPVLGLQAIFANQYVPILYGEQWNEFDAAQLVALLCLTGFPLLIMEATTQYLRAQGRSGNDLWWHTIFTLFFTLAILIGVNFDLLGVTLSVLIVQFIAALVRLLHITKSSNNTFNNKVIEPAGGIRNE